MNKSWRPKEGWQNPYWTPPSFEDSIGREFRWKREGKSKGETFEEGADAILEALTSQKHQDWLATPEGESCKGKWIFIPDEER